MARGTVSYVSVPPGSQDHDEAGVPPGSSNYDIILNRRQEWWWKPGPVDSFFLCFRLESGIAVLAVLRAMFNSILLLTLVQIRKGGIFRTIFMWYVGKTMRVMWEQFTTECQSDSPTLSDDDCRQLEQIIHAFHKYMRSQEYLPGIIFLFGYLKFFCMLVGLAGGTVGVWANFHRNTLAAKLFLWSWPANFALSVVSWIVWWLAMKQLTNNGLSALQLMPSTMTFVVSSIHLFFLVYLIKVSWSYYMLLKTRDTNASSSNVNDVELRGFRGAEVKSVTMV